MILCHHQKLNDSNVSHYVTSSSHNFIRTYLVFLRLIHCILLRTHVTQHRKQYTAVILRVTPGHIHISYNTLQLFQQTKQKSIVESKSPLQPLTNTTRLLHSITHLQSSTYTIVTELIPLNIAKNCAHSCPTFTQSCDNGSQNLKVQYVRMYILGRSTLETFV